MISDPQTITPAQLAALEAEGWVESASLQMADGCRMLLRRDGGGEMIVRLRQGCGGMNPPSADDPDVAGLGEYIRPGADIEDDEAAVAAAEPLPDVIPLGRFRRLVSRGWRCDPAARYVAGVGYVVTLWIGHAPRAHYRCVAVSTLVPPPGVTEVLS